MRPADLPPAEHYEHGTRARYVSGCRCDNCRAANTRAYHDRQRRALERLAEIEAGPPAEPIGRAWTRPDGTQAVRVFKRSCPGTEIHGCPWQSFLRKDSKGGICARCREELVADRLVDAARARRHIRSLSRRHVGRDAVAAAADVAVSVLAEIAAGTKLQIRTSTERRILAVDTDARADHAFVPAARTWKLIDKLLEEGFTRGQIAQRLGRQRAALQFGRDRVLAKTALQVERFYRQMTEVPE